jgi:hypothetical protein
MDADEQEEIDRIVNLTSVAVAVEIDKMIDALPEGANLVEVAKNLAEQLATMSKLPEFTDLMKRALLAHDAMEYWMEHHNRLSDLE